MKLAKLKMRRSNILKSTIRDKYGNMTKNAWNRWMLEEVEKLDKQIDKLNEEYIKTRIFKNLED